jgi:hypothetical protein
MAEVTYLTPSAALMALAEGRTLRNEDGFDILLDGARLILRYTAGPKSMEITNTYSGSFDALVVKDGA